ncbi:MAG: GntR family transcriptional regulator, partial [Solirubrobacteraceae bacterium]|nr:GntR family transcriptional regulator [Solirubrobacteraceae bacterium]
MDVHLQDGSAVTPPEPDPRPVVPGTARGRGTAQPHAERVYQALRSQLLRGERPAGVRLIEQRLAEEFDTSRTPVREAMRRLEGDGHLLRDASGGLTPRVPDVRTMHEFYDVRLALEDLTVRRATLDGDRAALQALQNEWIELGTGREPGSAASPEVQQAFVDADERFHIAVAAASGNRTAQHYLEEITDRIHVLRLQGFTIESRIDATVTEHLEILAAILSGDADAAAAFMRSHVQRNAAVVRSLVGQALSRMF